ncbi:disease resistance-like protein DSC1 [Pistacia vera]|uniref:disease resistance-like protein DSC1 n=1 Tax=Pistacia vera TaxID=55513 RepID=UPI001262E88B|nr:disease resistance-like protein DSC1 [Pistacia vera]
MASSSSVTNTPVKYEVFISFRGEDTRQGFASHLYAALLRKNVATFMDTELREGDEIKPLLLDAIEKSTISVVIFSNGYASSAWCLDELVKIVECKNRPTNRQILLPVFYHVDPTDVRNQSETYRQALAELEEKYRKKWQNEQRLRENVKKWRAALTEAANISGHDTKTTSNEAQLVEEIVNNILERLDHMFPSEDKGLIVGVERSITEVESLLRMGSEETISIGIWGMGGIGKTTIAKVVFNKIQNQFGSHFFYENVRETSMNLNQRTFTKRKRDNEKVLIVLDDVTLIEQIESLIGEFVDRLGPGSRIIITTRDKEVLQCYGVPFENIYEVKGLSDPEALQLFSWYAFKKTEPDSNHQDLSKRVVEYAQGIPLVLKEFGKFLYHKLDVWESAKDKLDVWASAIDKLQANLLREIQEKLKVSYDELRATYLKDQFLDIACFFKGESTDFVINYLDANYYEFKSTSDLDDLINKCLISITPDKKISVNDVLQVMAWEIVREGSRCRAERSRLWDHKDVSYVLKNNAGTEYVKGICLDMSQRTPFKAKGFGKMHDLRFFKVHDSHYEQNNVKRVLVSKDLSFVFTELRYLCWYGCTLDSLEKNFDTENLVALDMPHSEVTRLWTDNKVYILILIRR